MLLSVEFSTNTRPSFEATMSSGNRSTLARERTCPLLGLISTIERRPLSLTQSDRPSSTARSGHLPTRMMPGVTLTTSGCTAAADGTGTAIGGPAAAGAAPALRRPTASFGKLLHIGACEIGMKAVRKIRKKRVPGFNGAEFLGSIEGCFSALDGALCASARSKPTAEDRTGNEQSSAAQSADERKAITHQLSSLKYAPSVETKTALSKETNRMRRRSQKTRPETASGFEPIMKA